MNRAFWKLTATITICVFAVIAAINWRFYFATPILEIGDSAPDALQIHQAKHGRELYGNYSRYDFNHPGPAFFYVYALGERVLRDWLAVVPSANNAHSLAGLLLQSFFFAAALAIFAEYFRAPLFIPLALLLASVHFGLAHNAFTSTWPPHVLLMPFLCFFAASVAVASGRGGFLPLAVLAGSFLVHGHVAQPLFVVVLFVLAYGCLWRECRRTGVERVVPNALVRPPSPVARWGQRAPPWRRFPAAHFAAAAIMAVFLFPLVVDWLRWPNDNLKLILNQLGGNAGDHKSIRESAYYFLSFFSYIDNQQVLFPDLGPFQRHFLIDHALWYWGWAGIFGFVAWRWRSLAPAGETERAGFARNVAGFWVVTVLLCGVWGHLQTGDMWQYNGYFYFAVLYVPLALAAAAIADAAQITPRWGRSFGAWMCLGAVVLGASGFAIALPDLNGSGIPLLMATKAVLRADPHPTEPKILVFDHDDWGTVTAVGLVLDRANLPFSVDPILVGVMFPRQHWLPLPPTDDSAPPASVWRFLRRAPPGVGVPLVDGIRVSFSPGRLDPAHGVIDCSANGNLEQFVLTGLTTPARFDLFDGHRRLFYDDASTTRSEAVLDIASSAPAARDVVVDLDADPYLTPRKIPAQPMELWVNGILVGRAVLDHGSPLVANAGFTTYAGTPVKMTIPAAVWNRHPVVRFIMKFPAARSPAELGHSGDPRVLGWRIRRITFGYAP